MMKILSLKLAALMLVIFCPVGLTFATCSDFCSISKLPKKPHIVFLISEDVDNYQAHLTIPKFAEALKNKYETTVILGSGKRNAYQFPNLKILKQADLLVVFCRRLALPPDQMNQIKAYFTKGKPMIGIRTANHAFSVREEIEKGYVDWWNFVPEILGCENRGYGAEALGTEVIINPEQAKHPILEGIPSRWHSVGNVYKVAPLLDLQAQVLLTTNTLESTEPIAWVRSTVYNGRVFYTSLGHPTDFEVEGFRQLINNAIHWALDGHSKIK